MQAFTVKLVLSSAKGRCLTQLFHCVQFGVPRSIGLENAHDLGGIQAVGRQGLPGGRSVSEHGAGPD